MEPISLHFAGEWGPRKMELLAFLLVWFVWRAMGTETTQGFFTPKKYNMKITTPISEFPVLSELQCAMGCTRNWTCLSYSVTRGAGGGAFTCRFGYRYDEPRTADADSQFFYREVPAGYNLVPGTGSYVKMTIKSGKSAAAATACKNEGAQLVSSNNATVNSYVRQLRQNVSPGATIWVGGQMGKNKYQWVFPDGTTLTVTGPSQSYFCKDQPSGDGPCLHLLDHAGGNKESAKYHVCSHHHVTITGFSVVAEFSGYH
ncbi:unnamed protein product [Darwinula stevensoni]|uniref:C-type lectin domain-containing protein n=1 Tax=Darwinula stevensoni TaxID=69355 RepID=A0A7R9FPP8_9CRUS|nr:unnamed protein product [Darwinula stevensoni]CAG0898241.1 unnamed protein product [Darwinula stevensoni]